MPDFIDITDLHMRTIIGINPDERVNKQDIITANTSSSSNAKRPRLSSSSSSGSTTVTASCSSSSEDDKSAAARLSSMIRQNVIKIDKQQQQQPLRASERRLKLEARRNQPVVRLKDVKKDPEAVASAGCVPIR